MSATVGVAMLSSHDGTALDLTCAASPAPEVVRVAYEEAGRDLAPYLDGVGYYCSGLPELRSAIAAAYTADGLPTTADQVVVTPGAIAGLSLVVSALTAPGQRALVEDPVYPNAAQALTCGGLELVPWRLAADGWNGATLGPLLETSPQLAYLTPDFQNPTGLLMTEAQRHCVLGAIADSGAFAVVDEAQRPLVLDDVPVPAHAASVDESVITLGTTSKAFWGGLRTGWIRGASEAIERCADRAIEWGLKVPVLEQLVVVRLLEARASALTAQRERLRGQRDVLVGRLRELLPEWRITVPAGGMALWCELPEPLAGQLVREAARRGLSLSSGAVSSVTAPPDTTLRIPFVHTEDQLADVAERIGAAWRSIVHNAGSRSAR